MRAAICEIELFIPAANSLKAKRHVVKSVIERIKARCNSSVAETGYQDVWQRAAITVAIAGNSPALLERQMGLVRKIAEDSYEAEVSSFTIDYV